MHVHFVQVHVHYTITYLSLHTFIGFDACAYVNNNYVSYFFKKIGNLVVEAENAAAVPTQTSSKHVGMFISVFMYIHMFVYYHYAYSYCTLYVCMYMCISDQICKSPPPLTHIHNLCNWGES